MPTFIFNCTFGALNVQLIYLLRHYVFIILGGFWQVQSSVYHNSTSSTGTFNSQHHESEENVSKSCHVCQIRIHPIISLTLRHKITTLSNKKYFWHKQCHVKYLKVYNVVFYYFLHNKQANPGNYPATPSGVLRGDAPHNHSVQSPCYVGPLCYRHEISGQHINTPTFVKPSSSFGSHL